MDPFKMVVFIVLIVSLAGVLKGVFGSEWQGGRLRQHAGT